MYIWITNKCQQRCAHCCNVKLLGNTHMPEDIWKEAIKYSGHYGEMVALGGGEPLLHPDIERIVFHALGNKCIESTWFATNGLETEKAILFANFSRAYEDTGKFYCELSLDPYHIRPEEEVIKAFGKKIRNVYGREVNNGNYTAGSDMCCCPDKQIMINGDIRLCGCDESPIIGDIFNGIKPKFEKLLANLSCDACYKDIKKAKPRKAKSA